MFYQRTVLLGFWLCFSPVCLAGEIGAALSVQSHHFQHDPITSEQESTNYQDYIFEVSGGASIENMAYSAEATIYNHNLNNNFIDAEFSLTSDFDEFDISVGAKRVIWKKGNWFAFDVLNTRNTVFSLLEPNDSLSQPMVSIRGDISDYIVDAYVLAAHREQKFPYPGSRNRLPGEISHLKEKDKLGSNALAIRVQHSTDIVDFAFHTFYGLSRQPAIVISQNQDFNATYQEVLQVGGEFETNIENYRLWSQFFRRQGFRDIAGRESDYFASNVGIEGQWFNVAGKADILIDLEFNYDSRDKFSNELFGKSLQVKTVLTTANVKPWNFIASLYHDLNYGNDFYLLNFEKTITETPYLSVFVKYKKLTAGNTPNFLDYFINDTEYMLGFNLEL